MWWYNRKRKLNEERLSQFRPGDAIIYEVGSRVITRVVVNNDPETKSLSIKAFNDEIMAFSYGDSRFKNIRALNPDPTDHSDLKTFLNEIIANVGNQITDLQKAQAKDLIKSYKL